MDSLEHTAGAANRLVAVFPSMKARCSRLPGIRRSRSRATIPPGGVRKVLVRQVGLSAEEALHCLRRIK
jgi:hypothetical protein